MSAPDSRTLCLVLLLSAPPAAVAQVPIAVSPGDDQRVVPAAACPTFSWAGDAGRGDLEISVYAVSASGVVEGEPQLRQRVPRGATSWTPSADRCLASGRYAWTVRRIGDAEPWSAPRLFRVHEAAVDDLDRRMERAVERVLERWLTEGRLGPLPPGEGRGEGAQPTVAMVDPPHPNPLPEGEGTGASFIADAAAYDFPECDDEPPLFSDVPNASTLCPFIKQFVADQIATECAAGRFCPDNAVTRSQLAVYLEKVMRGTAQWDVTADLLDGLDSTAFLQLAGGTMAGTITLAGASPLVFEGATVNANNTVLGVTDPTSPRSIILPDASGEVSLLGQAIEASEIADPQRAQPVPLTSLLNCTVSAPIDFTSGLDASPDFTKPDGDASLRLTWDIDGGNIDTQLVCTTFPVPPDYASGGVLRLVSERGAAHNNDWFLSYRVLPVDGTAQPDNLNVLDCDAGGTAGDVYLCDIPLDALAADSGVSFALGRIGGTNAMTIYALEFVYTAVQ